MIPVLIVLKYISLKSSTLYTHHKSTPQYSDLNKKSDTKYNILVFRKRKKILRSTGFEKQQNKFLQKSYPGHAYLGMWGVRHINISALIQLLLLQLMNQTYYDIWGVSHREVMKMCSDSQVTSSPKVCKLPVKWHYLILLSCALNMCKCLWYLCLKEHL